MAGNPLVPNFNNPTAGLKVPKPKPAPKLKAPKKGPYSKPVKYKPNTKYAPNTPVRVGNQTVLTKGTTKTSSQASKPASSRVLDRPTPSLRGQKAAADRKKAYQSQPSLRQQVSGNPANTLSLPEFVHRVAGGIMGSGPGNDAVIIPGEGSLVDQVAEHITNGIKVGDIGKSLVEARQVVRANMSMGKNQSRVIFEKGSAKPLQSVVGDVVGPKSRSGILPHLQTVVDKTTQRAIDKGKLGSFVAKKNVANLVKTRQHFIDQLQRSTGEVLKSNNLKDEQRVALWMVAEDHAPSTARAFFAHEIASTTSARVKHDLTNMSALFEDASKYVKEDAHGNITLHGNAPRAMHQTWGWMQKADAARMAQGTKIGAINPETAANRLSAPGRVMQGARVNPETGHLEGAESFTGGKVFVTSRQNERITGIGRARVSDIVTNRFRKAVGLTGEYHGTNLLTGRQDVNAPKLVGQANLSMQRFFHRTEGLRNLQEVAQGTQALPEDLKHFQAVKLGDLSHSEKVDLNNALDAIKAEKMPTRQAMKAANKAFGNVLDRFLPESEMNHLLSSQQHYGFVWKPLTGDRAAYVPITNLEHYLLDVPSGALKTLIVYTKLPGHIPARRLSNGFFNLAQMGTKLLPIAIKQLILNHKYPDWATYMQMLTGEGSLESIASTKLQHTLTNVVRKYSDANPRRMSVYYELERVAGRSLNPDEAVALLKQMHDAPQNSKLGQELVNLAQRSSVHAGDYSRLSQVEKRLISKVLFLWTWHRTAAVTLGKVALEHPIATAAAGAGTYYLNEKVNAGQEPWNKFNVPLNRVGLPGKVANITTSFPPSQPIQDVHALANIGKPVFGQTLGGELNPFIATGLATATGRNLETGSGFKNRWDAVASLSSQVPPVALTLGKKSVQDRVIKYFLGNEAPQSAPGPVISKSEKDLVTRAVKAGILKKGQPLPEQIKAELLVSHVKHIRGMKGLKAEVGLLVKLGKLTKRQAEGLTSHTLSNQAITLARQALSPLLATPGLDAYHQIITQRGG